MGKTYAMTVAGLIAIALAAGVTPRSSAAPLPFPNKAKSNLIVNGSFEVGPEFKPPVRSCFGWFRG